MKFPIGAILESFCMPTDDAVRRAAWRAELLSLARHGIVSETVPDRFALTDRGFEVCDAVISAIMSVSEETAA